VLVPWEIFKVYGGQIHAVDGIGFEGVALLCQFLHALGIRLRGIWHLLNVSRLSR